MRVAIIGAHKVGKTILAEELLESLPDYSLETEPYYQLALTGYEFSEIPSPEDFVEQFNFSADLISQSKDNIIFDRCVFDLLAYLHVLDPNRDIQFMFEKAQLIISEIDLLVFVPIEDPDMIPKHQIEFVKLRNQVNDLLYDWIDDFGIEVLEVHGSIFRRRDQVLERMNK